MDEELAEAATSGIWGLEAYPLPGRPPDDTAVLIVGNETKDSEKMLP